MAQALPIEAQVHYVPGNIPETIKKLTAAAERGEFGYGVVAAFIQSVEKGGDPRFMLTRPVPLAIRKAIEANPHMEPRQVVYVGVRGGAWTMEDAEAFEANAEALSKVRRAPAPRGIYLTRSKRAVPRRTRTTNAFTPKMSLDAVCDFDVCDGAKTTLALLMARAGRSDVLVTYTSSIATQLGRTTRTIRNHFMQLEEAGLIRRKPGLHQNTVEIEILEACRPDPYQEPEDIAAYRKVRKSRDPAVRRLARTVVSMAAAGDPGEPRRKRISGFNPESGFLDSAPPLETAAAAGPRGHSHPTTHSTLWKRTPKRQPTVFLPGATARSVTPGGNAAHPAPTARHRSGSSGTAGI